MKRALVGVALALVLAGCPPESIIAGSWSGSIRETGIFGQPFGDIVPVEFIFEANGDVSMCQDDGCLVFRYTFSQSRVTIVGSAEAASGTVSIAAQTDVGQNTMGGSGILTVVSDTGDATTVEFVLFLARV